MSPAAVRDRLDGWYRRYIGEPDADTDLYLGFGLFFGGIGFGLLGLLLFLWSGTLDPGTLAEPNMFYWTLRETATALALVGLPALMVGIVVLLPVGRRVLYAAGGGTAVTLLAVAAFVAVYPFNFNVQTGTDYAPQVVAVYALGLVALIGATGAALVAHHLDRAAAAATGGEESTATSAASGEDVSEERVERDIEEAMEGAELSWGGVEKTESRRLRISTDADGEEIDTSGFDGAGANTTTTRSESIDEAVDGLRQLRGGEQEEARGSSVDDQAAALQELRESQRHEEERRRRQGLLDRVKDGLGLD